MWNIFSHSAWMWGIFYKILTVPRNIVMNLNHVMCMTRLILQLWMDVKKTIPTMRLDRAQNISWFNSFPIGRFYVIEGVKLTSPYEFSGEGVLVWIGVGPYELATPHAENSWLSYPKSKIVANPSWLHNNNKICPCNLKGHLSTKPIWSAFHH